MRQFEDLGRQLHFLYLRIWRSKAFWLRAFLCWLIGIAFFLNEQDANYDLRFQIRGTQVHSDNVVLVDITERDWSRLQDHTPNILRPLKEIQIFSDSFFWNPQIWSLLLEKIQSGQPDAIGVTFFFGEFAQLPPQPSLRRAFTNDKTVWAADQDNSGRVLVSNFVTSFDRNAGLKSLIADSDGIVRRFSSPLVQVPHMSLQLARHKLGDLTLPKALRTNRSVLINYMGPSGTFTSYNFLDIINGKIPPAAFQGKIVLIGSSTAPTEQLQTPLGRMSRSEVMANIIDNLEGQKWISRFKTSVYFAALAFMLALSLWILTGYPQSIALVFFLIVASIGAAISAGVFDLFYFWLPVFSPLMLLFFTYIIFLSYQLAQNEQRAWRLQQEQLYSTEIEKLKSNFVSMMSHDLKTPIAKIQAIVDRLLNQYSTHELVGDLKNLRRSSDDLHKYIQSILRVVKIEARDFQLHKEVTDINDLVEKVVQQLRPLADEKNTRLETDLEPMFSIEVDTTLIQEVILNLVENAIKYSPPESLIRIISRETEQFIEIAVIDNGPGIDPQEQADIWQKFTRGKKQGFETKGSGLGLYLVKYFIELHGGQVFLESQLDKGTRIGFSIPVGDG